MHVLLRKSLPYLWLAIVFGLFVFLHTVGLTQPPGGNNRGGNPRGPGGGFPGVVGVQPGRGGGPGGMIPGTAVGNQPGRGGPGGLPPGGGMFPGAANLATRGGAPGAGGPSGGFPGGGGMFPGAANLATRGGAGGPSGGFPGGGGFPTGGMMNIGGAMPVAAAQQPRQQNNSGSAAASLLVPEFGEKQPDTPRVLRFGDNAETTSTTTSGGRNSGNANSADAETQRRINDQAQQLMNRFDRDRNGMIERTTGEWNNLSFEASLVDTNRDGRITLDELRVYVGKQVRGGGTSGAKIFTSYGATYEHMPDGIPAWFTERDKNNDGQLTLFEYANGQPITDAVVSEFEWLDLNNDGIATLEECYSAIKTKEDQERKALEEAGLASGNARAGNQPQRSTNITPARGANNSPGGSFTPGADQNDNRNNQTTRPGAATNNNPNPRGMTQQTVRPAPAAGAAPGRGGGAAGRGAGSGPGGGGFGGGGAGRGGG